MSIYSDKLAHVLVVINCRYSVAQMCIRKDTQACLFTRAVLDDVMSQDELTTFPFKKTSPVLVYTDGCTVEFNFCNDKH